MGRVVTFSYMYTMYFDHIHRCVTLSCPFYSWQSFLFPLPTSLFMISCLCDLGVWRVIYRSTGEGLFTELWATHQRLLHRRISLSLSLCYLPISLYYNSSGMGGAHEWSPLPWRDIAAKEYGLVLGWGGTQQTNKRTLSVMFKVLALIPAMV